MSHPNNNMRQQPYDASESPSHMEAFEDEPQRDPYRQPNGQQPEQSFGDHDPYARPSSAPPQQRKTPSTATPEPRKHKYSTATMNETGKWKKWCSIFLLFLFFILFMIGMSILFNHFFFSDQSDNGPGITERPENTTFPLDKQEVDQACSTGSFLMDQGETCKEACVPQFFACCDPFDEFNLYNFTADANATVMDDDEPDKNMTFLEEYEDFDATTCSFDQDLRGCMSYAKCQALGGQVDPAPANLPDLCSLERLAKDDDGCKDLCRKLDCCYSIGSDNCLADKFDLCMDYAPCQNLRPSAGLLETAPRTLDFDCYWQQPTCGEVCEAARCCDDASNSCFQANFLSCLTYSPCNNVTEVSVTVGPQFGVVHKPPNEIIYACNANNEPILEPTTRDCETICTEAACCWSDNPSENCFHEDPLGCLAWDAQCQVLLGDAPQRHV